MVIMVHFHQCQTVPNFRVLHIKSLCRHPNAFKSQYSPMTPL